MRHYKKGRKLGTDASHTKAMKKSLVGALFLNDRIKTGEARAKEVRGDVDRVIGWAKRGDVHSRRLAIAALGDKDLVAEIFQKVEQGMFKDRTSGYTRILKLGNRKGDNAPMVILELVTEPVAKKKAAKAESKKSTTSKQAPKKVSATEAEAQKEAAEDLEKIEEEIKEEAAESMKEAEAAGDDEEAVEDAETIAKAAEAEDAEVAAGEKAEDALIEAKEDEASAEEAPSDDAKEEETEAPKDDDSADDKDESEEAK